MPVTARRRWWTAFPHVYCPVLPRPRQRGRRAPWAVVAAEVLEDRTLLSTFSSVSSIEPLQTTSIAGNTGEKPQSKVWEYADAFWSVFSDDSGTHVFRLDGTAWTSILTLSTQQKVKADVVVQGDVAHVLMEKGNGTRLASLEYIAAAGTYDFWSTRPDLVELPLGSVETATIDIDTMGRLWLAYDNGSQIDARYSDAPYALWSGPITIASGIDDDDISAVVAFDGQIGVFWSDQNMQRFGFRVHVDGDDPLLWSANELPGAQSALNIGKGMADDHINLAAASDGTLYAAVKTSYDKSSATAIGLLVRRPDGTWDSLYEVDTQGTRPIVELNEATGSLLVIYREQNTSGPILYRESSISTIAFGERTTLLAGTGWNDPSGMKHNSSSELVVIASDGGLLGGARLRFGAVENQAPFVDAGENQSVGAGLSLLLDGTVLDDGLPNPPGAVSTLWTMMSGAGTVTFADPMAIDTAATFDAIGTYVLRLTADDSEFSTFDEITVTVVDPATPITLTLRDGVDGYAGMQDTRIRADQPDRNFGRSDRLQVDGTPDIATLLRWDLSTIPAGSAVSSASITLFVLDASRHAYEIYEALRPWVETEATFNQAAAGMPWEVLGAAGTTDRGAVVLGSLHAATAGSLSIELNAAGLQTIEAWLNDPSRNHGFLIQDYDDATFDNAAFRSRNTTAIAERPALTVSYLPPSESETMAIASASNTSLLTLTESTASPPTSPELEFANSFVAVLSVALPQSAPLQAVAASRLAEQVITALREQEHAAAANSAAQSLRGTSLPRLGTAGAHSAASPPVFAEIPALESSGLQSWLDQAFSDGLLLESL